MNEPVITKLQELLFYPQANHYGKLRQAIWLYAYLLICAHPESGRLIISSEKVAAQLNVKGSTIQSWLGHLKKLRYLTARHQGLTWAITLTGWSVDRKDAIPALITDEGIDEDEPKDEITPKLLHQRLGNGEGTHYYEALVKRYDQDILKRALSEVELIPSSRIKKSKGALFTYLVKKYAQEEIKT